MKPTLRVGGACGFWGESNGALTQFLAGEDLDFVVFDYLAEITMSILARARAADPQKGYAADFVKAVLAPNLEQIAEQGVRIVSNAGGMNPQACGEAVRELVRARELNLKVAVITGDDLMGMAAELAERGVSEMFSGEPFPPVDRVASVNAYLGAFPIAAALDAGADIVITGRIVDSAATLGACIHHFGWSADQLDALAGGSLAGHILECSTQATGGNFTDWEEVADTLAEIGYPIAEVSADGTFVCTKPDGTGGQVSIGTIAEQMLYEIEDPQNYTLPDVRCDFSDVRLEQPTEDRVRVSGARGAPPPEALKVSATWADGFRAGHLLFLYGEDASQKAWALADAAVSRVNRALEKFRLEPLSETLVEVFGDESHYGGHRRVEGSREVVLKIAGKHPRAEGIGILLKETIGLALAAPPGLTLFSAGGRPKPSPVVRLFSFLVEKDQVQVDLHLEGKPLTYRPPESASGLVEPDRPEPPTVNTADLTLIEVSLFRLARGRSGDKGNRANIGIIARKAEYLPWIWRSITEDVVAERFAHFLEGRVERYLLPGPSAINFVLHDVLGGGGIASLRNDPQGKGYAQLLLAAPVAI
ncbi:MAG: acyclic terpene utilization AtuA family protein, partial [Xanthomonadales bacterium]|nr:acyclic terpene utilization AtuA family protein [Xanthomonadales bacterium]